MAFNSQILFSSWLASLWLDDPWMMALKAGIIQNTRGLLQVNNQEKESPPFYDANPDAMKNFTFKKFRIANLNVLSQNCLNIGCILYWMWISTQNQIHNVSDLVILSKWLNVIIQYCYCWYT